MVTQNYPVSPWSATRVENETFQARIPLRLPPRQHLLECLAERQRDCAVDARLLPRGGAGELVDAADWRAGRLEQDPALRKSLQQRRRGRPGI